MSPPGRNACRRWFQSGKRRRNKSGLQPSEGKVTEDGRPDGGWSILQDPEFGVGMEEDGDVLFGGGSDLEAAFDLVLGLWGGGYQMSHVEGAQGGLELAARVAAVVIRAWAKPGSGRRCNWPAAARGAGRRCGSDRSGPKAVSLGTKRPATLKPESSSTVPESAAADYGSHHSTFNHDFRFSRPRSPSL